MNKLQQAAKEYSEQNSLGDSIIKTTVKDAFLAGAAYAAGAFAEWCLNNCFTLVGSWIYKGDKYTTAELYQLWQQSL